MFGVGPVEFMVVLVLALIVFGPEKLPEMMRSAGHAIREFQRYSSELTATFQETTQEFTSAMDVSEVTDVVQDAVQSVTVNGTAAHEEAPGYAETVAVAEVSQVSATAVPSEYDTAAAMLDPVEPFFAPESSVVEAEPVQSESSDVPEPAPKPRRARKKPVATEGIPLESMVESA